MSGMTNAEKGRKYGKKMGEYDSKNFGVIGELRYSLKTQKWAITVGDVAVTGATQKEVEQAIEPKLEELSKVSWYKIMRVEFKESHDYNRDFSAGVKLNITRNVVAKMNDGDWRAVNLKHRLRVSDEGIFVTEDELFDPDFKVTHEFAMSQNYSNYYMGWGRELHPDKFPVTIKPSRHRDMATYMLYDPNTWDKLKLMIDAINSAQEQILRLVSVDEEVGFIPLIELGITPGNNILVAGGDDEERE